MNFEAIIKDIYLKTKTIADTGELASYIPELSTIDSEKFGVHISTINQFSFGIGDHCEKFSIQSIAKILSLSLAYGILGEKIWSRIGVEPSGNAFNSLIQLEADNGIPRNPFINSGAIVICDILLSHLENPKEDFLTFVRDISSNSEIKYSKK